MSERDIAMESVLDLDRATILAGAEAVCDAARIALAEAVEESSVARAAGRALGIDKSLAWKLVSLTQAPGPAEAMSLFPGPRGWQRIIEALSEHGAAEKQVDVLRRAVTAFDRECERRGFDRRRLKKFSSDAGDSDRSRHEALRLREAATNANTAIWGMGVSTLVASYLLHPTGESDELAISAVTMFLGLHRSRPGPEMAIHRRSRIQTTAGTDAAAEGDELAIDCEDLCSPGAVAQTSTQMHRRGPCVTFRGDGTSPANPVDLVFAERLPSTGYQFARQPGEHAGFGLPIWVPVQTLVLEVLLHRDIPWTGDPSPTGFSEIVGVTHQTPWRDLHEFPITEKVEPAMPLDTPKSLTLPALRAGSSKSAATAYATAITRAADAIGSRPEDLVRHRLIVPHPLLSSNVVLRWPMPTRDERA